MLLLLKTNNDIILNINIKRIKRNIIVLIEIIKSYIFIFQ